MKNKGYSLLEVIVVIAILGVITGFLITSSGLLDGRRVKACADNISSLLEKVRMTNLGKDEVILTIYEDAGNGIKADIVTKVKSKAEVTGSGGTGTERTVVEDLSNDNVEIHYSTDISGSSPVFLGTDKMYFNFSRNSGSIQSTTPAGIRCILVRKGNAEKKIKIYAETGKISLE